jgi:hypothetical protein
MQRGNEALAALVEVVVVVAAEQADSSTVRSFSGGHSRWTPTFRKSPKAHAKSPTSHSGRFSLAMATQARRGRPYAARPADSCAAESAMWAYDRLVNGPSAPLPGWRWCR